MDGSITTMSIFKAFGANQRPTIRLIKTGCVEGSIKIPVGQVVEGTFVSEVSVGKSFNLDNATVIEGGNGTLRNTKGVQYSAWCTSVVQEILSDDTFRTKNSVYRLEIISKK